MSKINQHLLDREQKGKETFIPPPAGFNDAHGCDDIAIAIDLARGPDFSARIHYRKNLAGTITILEIERDDKKKKS
jgi:hypothetical protein